MNRLAGKVAVITGGGGGIGGATSRRFVEEGAKVAVLDKNAAAAQTIADELTDAGGQSLALGIDVTDLEGLKQGLLEIEKVLGGVDILVNNAGWDLFRPFLKTDPEFWRKIIDINLIGALNMHHVVLPGMVERSYGRVVSVSSDAGRVGEPHLAVYSGAKAGAAGFMRAIAKAGGRFGITANCVALGGTRTPAVADLIPDAETEKRALSQYVIRRLGEPEDPAGMILFLCSDAASWITGQTYPVNGGYSFAC